MPELSNEQVIHIRAGLAFANLAARETRPRRRRGAGRGPTVTNTTPRCAPLGTPLRQASSSAYSHIQIVPKESLENSMDEERSPQPMFRKPSLAQEADAAITDLIGLVPSASTDSIANNTTGTTFAAKARAAELQAARARKQLKENDTQNEPLQSATPHEVMTFTKSRSKGGRTWKALNLNDLSEVPIEASQNGMYRASPEPTAATSSYLSSQSLDCVYDNVHGFADAGPGNDTSDPFPQINMLTSSYPQTGLSPDTLKLMKSVESYDISQWDPELPATDAVRTETSPASVSPQTRPRASSTAVALRPLPVLTTSSDQLQKQALYLHQKQESQLSEVHAALSGRLHHNSRDASSAVESVMALLAQEQPSKLFSAEAAKVNNGDDSFTASPSPVSPPQYARQPSYDRSETGYDLAGPAPRKFVPHQYPAVKGTMNAVPRLGPQRTLTQDSSIQQPTAHVPLEQSPYAYHCTQEPQTPYRKLSVAEKKGLLLQQLQTVVDESASSAGFPKSSRTVLHDPFAYKPEDVGAKTAPPVLANPDIDLVVASSPLPWKTRPVKVVRPPSLSNIDSPPSSNREVTPLESRQFRGTSYMGQRSPAYFTDAALVEAERWWSAGSRMDSLSTKRMTGFLGRVLESPSGMQKSDVAEYLLAPVLANLQTYLTPGGYFNKHGRVAEWCIDQGANGQTSFFGEDWGAPPPRVGRDPRYQPVLHEGTRSIYENVGTRWGAEVYPRRYPIR